MNISKKLLLGVLIIFSFSGIVISQEMKIAIIKSSNSSSFQTVTEGVKKEIRKGIQNPIFVEYDLSANHTNEAQLVDEVKKLNPHLIITIGSKSTAIFSKEIKHIPIIFTAVLNPISSGFVESMQSSGNNLTGASLDIPIRTQLDKFKMIVPSLKKLGIIYTKDSEPVVREVKKTCAEIGLELISTSISSEKEIPVAIEKLGSQVDGLWAVADTVIFTPQSTQYLLLYSLRNGIPFAGPFISLVKAGALFTLAWDDKDIGRQSGELALKILKGQTPDKIPVTTPRMIYLILNLRTANQINLEIPSHIVSVAKEVYQ